ncbi:hypothetical protein TW65_01747 [Stemphylium lycopersici]|nr:hypothetical protein TW65_01747 [Stemphylium lycopersici]
MAPTKEAEDLGAIEPEARTKGETWKHQKIDQDDGTPELSFLVTDKALAVFKSYLCRLHKSSSNSPSAEAVLRKISEILDASYFLKSEIQGLLQSILSSLESSDVDDNTNESARVEAEKVSLDEMDALHSSSPRSSSETLIDEFYIKQEGNLPVGTNPLVNEVDLLDENKEEDEGDNKAEMIPMEMDMPRKEPGLDHEGRQPKYDDPPHRPLEVALNPRYRMAPGAFLDSSQNLKTSYDDPFILAGRLVDSSKEDLLLWDIQKRADSFTESTLDGMMLLQRTLVTREATGDSRLDRSTAVSTQVARNGNETNLRIDASGKKRD